MATMTRWLSWLWRPHCARDQIEVIGFGQCAHLPQDPVAPLEDVARWPIRMQALGVRQDGGELRRLARGQLGRGDVEECMRGRFHPEDSRTELHHVEIGFEDALLRPQRFEQHRKPRLDGLAQVAAAGPQKEVLRELLRDCACAVQPPAFRIIDLRRVDRVDVESVVKRKLLILRGDDSERRGRGDARVIDPFVVGLIVPLTGGGCRRLLLQHEGARDRMPHAQQQYRKRRQHGRRENQRAKPLEESEQRYASSTRRAEMMVTSSSGASWYCWRVPVRTAAILSTTSRPSTTRPNTA